MGGFKSSEPKVKPVHHWVNQIQIPVRSYKCSYCDNEVASQWGCDSPGRGYGYLAAQIYFCPLCGLPTYFSFATGQLPLPKFGSKVQHISNVGVNELYEEARVCYSSKAYTSAILCCRKILMNVAVAQGAPHNRSFVEYVDYLDSNHYVPPGGRQYIDEIRNLGNDATHEIQSKGQREAELAIYFIELLLRNIYEAPGKLQTSRQSP